MSLALARRDIDIASLLELYCEKKLTARSCAKYFGVCSETITRKLRQNNIAIRPNKYFDIEILEKLYIEQGKSIKECSDILNIDKATISNLLGDNIRNIGSPKGLKKSEETKRKMSGSQIKLHKDLSITEGMKKCTNCKKILPMIDFYNRTRRGGSITQQCNCKNCSSDKSKEYRLANIDEVRRKAREYTKIHKEELRIKSKESAIQLKKDAFNAYGGIKCTCCGETELIFLTIDHINGGGSQHRKKIKNSMYQWLKNNNYPHGYRVLCFNCNWAEANGGCPHVISK